MAGISYKEGAGLKIGRGRPSTATKPEKAELEEARKRLGG